MDFERKWVRNVNLRNDEVCEGKKEGRWEDGVGYILDWKFVEAASVAVEAHEGSTALAWELLLLRCLSYPLDDYSPNKARQDTLILSSKFPHSIIRLTSKLTNQTQPNQMTEMNKRRAEKMEKVSPNRQQEGWLLGELLSSWAIMCPLELYKH